MKKKLLTAAFVTVGLFAAGYSSYLGLNKNGFSDIALSNIEALADAEIIIGPWYCVGNEPGCHIITEPYKMLDGVKHYF